MGVIFFVIDFYLIALSSGNMICVILWDLLGTGFTHFVSTVPSIMPRMWKFFGKCFLIWWMTDKWMSSDQALEKLALSTQPTCPILPATSYSKIPLQTRTKNIMARQNRLLSCSHPSSFGLGNRHWVGGWEVACKTDSVRPSDPVFNIIELDNCFILISGEKYFFYNDNSL